MSIFIKKCLAILLFYGLSTTVCYMQQKTSLMKMKDLRQTSWKVLPSLKYDTLCFLNILTGDPFYLRFYKNEYAKFEPQLTPNVRQALANLKRKIKEENKGIISAHLSLYFSATDDKNINDMLKTLKNTSKMQTTLKNSVFYSEKDWQIFESSKDDLRVILLFLKKIKFEQYWKQNILPRIERKIAEITPDLPKYNIVKEIEDFTTYQFSSNEIEANILYFANPHGIRVTGLRFLMNYDTPFKQVVFIAIHELIHEPVRTLIPTSGDLKNNTKLKEFLEQLRNDEFLMDKVNNHNPSLGYNSLEGLLNEDATQALDQIISEKMGVEREEPHKRWKDFDEGIHVFAVALYSLLKEEKFPQKNETLADFLLRMFNTNRLSPGKIKPLYDKFYADYKEN